MSRCTFFVLFVLVCVCFADELGPGQYLAIPTFGDCEIAYTITSTNNVPMSVYLVDQTGYDQISSVGFATNYYSDCSCLNTLDCSVDNCTTPNSYNESLHVVITHSLLSTAEYDFEYSDSCLLAALVAIFGVIGLTILSVILCCCCGCCCCAIFGVLIAVAVQQNNKKKYGQLDDLEQL